MFADISVELLKSSMLQVYIHIYIYTRICIHIL